MGICKCKKRSEDFCYQHKKFICETCVLSDHPVCHIGSYVNWLTDSEFEESVCGICKGEVTSDNSIRLLCYDLFHPECIDVYASTLPQTTALAGYSCPTCKKPILPPSDKSDPLSNSIRKAFSLSSWAESILNISNGGGGGKFTNGTASISSQILSPNGNSDHYLNGKTNASGVNDYHLNGSSPTSSIGSSSINSSLLEETPPLSHLNNNPYGLAIRKPQQHTFSTNTNTTLTDDTVINMGEHHHHQDEEEDKYNKKILPFQSLMRFKEDNPKLFYLILAIICITTFYVFSKFNSSSLSTDNNNPPPPSPAQGGQGNNPTE